MPVTAEAQPEKQQSPAWQSEQHTDGHLFHRHQPQYMSPSQANPWTRSHAQSGLATFTFHFSTVSSRVESIQAAQCNRWQLRVISANKTGHDSYPEVTGCANGIDLSPTAVSYLLWGREAAPHWPGWMSTSWRTPPPRPRHSHSRSTGKEEGHKARRKAAERGTKCFLRVGQTSSVNMWLRRREIAASRGLSAQSLLDHQVAL